MCVPPFILFSFDGSTNISLTVVAVVLSTTQIKSLAWLHEEILVMAFVKRSVGEKLKLKLISAVADIPTQYHVLTVVYATH